MSNFNFNIDTIDDIHNSLSKSKYNSISLKKIIELIVDLGLPSGTLWCKYNLDVDPNLLSNPKDWLGSYYAWGELDGNKPIYDWDHYEHGYGPYDFYKYVNNKEYAADDNNKKVDNLIKLLPEDDAAYQKQKLHNYKFHIPTKELCEELINCTSNYWVNNYDPNKIIHNSKDDEGIKGLNGRVFEGRNGNLLFIPAAGRYNISTIYGDWTDCYLWSSSLDLSIPSYAYYLYFSSDSIYMNDYNRCSGYSVHPVINL